MTIKVKIVGDQQLGRILGELGAKLQRNTIRNGLRRAAKVIAAEVSVLAPHEEGKPDLRDTPHVSTSTRGGLPTAKIRLKGPHSYLGLWMEFGTAPHLIASKDGGPMKIGDHVFEGPILHPGIRNPKPFMRPAFDAKADEAVEVFTQYLRDQIKKKGWDTPAEPDDDE